MNIAILHNNLNKWGGGEKVSLTVIDELSKQGHAVTVYTLKKPEINKINEYYGMNLDKNIEFIHYDLKILHRAYYADYLLSRKLSKLDEFDIIIDTSSNGFYPINNQNSKTICYVHFPMHQKPDSLLLKIYSSLIYHKIGHKYKNYDSIIVNSNFTREYLEKNYIINSDIIDIIYPPTTIIHPPKNNKQLLNAKEDIILVVGRFAPDKKILFLMRQFKEILKSYPTYKMHIAGTPTPYHCNYYKNMIAAAKGYPIKLHPQISKIELDKLYKKSRIYWHAKGYGESDPILFEHFGITTVEAMNNGCIPIVINKGGQKEIVDHKINGFLWDNTEELHDYTNAVINKGINSKITENAIKKSTIFDDDIFRKKIVEFVDNI